MKIYCPLLLSFLLLFLTTACSDGPPPETSTEETAAETTPPDFTSRQIVDSARWWWALATGDVSGDGLQDIVYIDNNANGGYLAYRSGQRGDGIWPETIIATIPPTGGTFAAGDLETADMDGDGDTDVLAVKHTGEWDQADDPAEVFWYENPGDGSAWTPHAVGDARGAVKDLSVADFTGDGRADIAVLTFENENLRIHEQLADGSFSLRADLTAPGLHEGMDVGDLDGDGDIDVAANGYIFYNPGQAGEWETASVDERWYTQTGDWSANGTKNFVTDLDGDGTPEIFISHSERGGYPLALYRRNDDGSYTAEEIVKDWPAAHTLQVFDMDGDGRKDIVTGINRGRAVNLEPRVDHHEVTIFFNRPGGWERHDIEQGGIYNGRVADFEGDGDYDLFRLPDHESKTLYLLENTSK